MKQFTTYLTAPILYHAKIGTWAGDLVLFIGDVIDSYLFYFFILFIILVLLLTKNLWLKYFLRTYTWNKFVFEGLYIAATIYLTELANNLYNLSIKLYNFLKKWFQ